MGSLPERGDLAETPLPRLLIELHRTRATKALRLERGRTSKRIVLFEGALISVASNLPRESLSAVLQSEGAISSAQAQELESNVERKACSEAAAALGLGLADPGMLFSALKTQQRQRLLECFAWPDGRFALRPTDAPPEQERALRTHPLPILQEGLAAHWSAEQMLADLAPKLASKPTATRRVATLAERLQRDAALDAVLAGLDGSQTLESLVGRAFSSPSALAALWIFDGAHLLEYDRESSDPAGFHGQIEIEVVDAPDEAAKTTPKERASERGPRSGEEAKADALRKEILERHDQLDELDFYAVLGIPADAKSPAVKKAYFTAAKRYHPDALGRLGLGDLKAQAAEVFARIAEANEVLSDVESRKLYDASLADDGPALDVNRLAQAEGFFRKGEVMVRMGDFRGALEFLKPAAELWPDECAYQSLLGWALFKQSPPELERAHEALERATALKPDDAEAHYRLSLVLRALGHNNAANDEMARARAIDPRVG